MSGALTAAGAGIAAAVCCLAIPLTVGIIGVSDLAAFGANLGVVAIIASALVVLSFAWRRSRCGGDGADGG
jgi:hypothetical protein